MPGGARGAERRLGGDGETASRPDRAFLGLVAEDAFGKPGAYRRENLDRLRATGAGLVRQTFDWARIERAPGRYDLSFYDDYVAALARRHLRVLPILFDPPPFRSSAPAEAAPRDLPAARAPADMGEFGGQCSSRRYGPGGSFWRAHPELPQLPVRSWQVWNEPNLPVYWPSGPDAAEYVALLRATGRGIRTVDPGAEIVTAGLPDSSARRAAARVRGGNVRRRAAREPSTRWRVNPYGLDATGRARHREDGAQGRRRRTATTRPCGSRELGWATGGPPSRFLVSEARSGRAPRADAAGSGAPARRSSGSAASSTSIGAIPLPTPAAGTSSASTRGCCAATGRQSLPLPHTKRWPKRSDCCHTEGGLRPRPSGLAKCHSVVHAVLPLPSCSRWPCPRPPPPAAARLRRDDRR